MARNKIGLQFDGWERYMEKLDELGGKDAMMRGVEAGLRASKQYVNPQIFAALKHLPAKGKYSTGRTEQSVDKSMDIRWHGLTGEIDVGFDFDISGPVSIFLMYGTPRMSPVSGLKNAIYGTKTKRQIKELQEEAVSKVIKRIMEG